MLFSLICANCFISFFPFQHQSELLYEYYTNFSREMIFGFIEKYKEQKSYSIKKETVKNHVSWQFDIDLTEREKKSFSSKIWYS